MGLINYKMQKILLFAATGFIPLFSFVMMTLFNVNILVSVIVCMLMSLFLVFVGHKVSSMNPFIKAIQEKRVLIFDINSTGIARVFTASVQESPNNTGIDISMDTGETRAYDRSITHLLQAPQKAIMKFIFNKENPKESMVHIELSNEEFKKAAWYNDYLTMLFYNSQIGTFVTKPLISEQEKSMLVEYLTLNEARELRSLNNTFLSLMRHTFDLISQRFMGFLNSPLIQIVIIGLVLLVVGYLAYTYLPGLLGMVPAVVNGAVSGQVVEPLTKGAVAAPLTLMRVF